MESSPDASRTSTPTNNDAEQRRRAVEVGSYVKKLLDAYRLLEEGHSSFEEIEKITWDKFSHYLKNFGELSMEISPTTISIEDKNVVEASRKTESVSFALFAEGIHEVLFGQALTLNQLKGFLVIWAEACKNIGEENTEETVSITTKVWESDFDAIELIALQSVQEGSEESDDAEHRNDMRLAIQAISGAGDAEEGGSAKGLLGGTGASGALNFWTKAAETDGVMFSDRLQVDDGYALQLLSSEIQLPVGSQHTNQSYSSAAAINLTERRLIQMREEISHTWSESHSINYINSVFMLAHNANSDELEALIAPLEKVFTNLCRSKSFERLLGALEQAQAGLLSQATNPNYCYQVIEALLSALRAPTVIEPLIDSLEHPATRDNAYKLLQRVPASHVIELIERLDRLHTPLGIDAMLKLISDKNPQTADLARIASQSKPEIARAILKLAGHAKPDDAHFIRRTVLCHPDARIRKNILDSIPLEEVPANIEEIRTLIKDQEADIRTSAMLLVVQVRDSGSISILSSIVSGEYNLEEQKKALVGIARIGGTEAGLALRKIFLQQKNMDLRCVAALGLGEMGDESARSMLEKEANRVLARGQLKASCAEAIRRLDAHKQVSTGRARN